MLLLFDWPPPPLLPRRMASRPVEWMAEMMVEGGVMPVMWRSWVARSARMEWMPGRGVRIWVRLVMQAGQWRGTKKVVWFFGKGGERG